MVNVIVRIFFDKPAEEDWQAMRSLAIRLTNDPDSVRVTADPDAPDWLAAEFTMPSEAQYQAVGKIDGVLRFGVENRLDSCIGFPRSATDVERARRKNERRKARRRAKRSME